jgi:hypothetical protein
MLELLTNIGIIINAGIILIGLSIFLIMRVEWRCGLCGKLNETGLLRFLFLMCNHEGDT